MILNVIAFTIVMQFGESVSPDILGKIRIVFENDEKRKKKQSI